MKFQDTSPRPTEAKGAESFADDHAEAFQQHDGNARSAKPQLDDNQCQQHQQPSEGKASAVHTAGVAKQQKTSECRLQVCIETDAISGDAPVNSNCNLSIHSALL